MMRASTNTSCSPYDEVDYRNNQLVKAIIDRTRANEVLESVYYDCCREIRSE